MTDQTHPMTVGRVVALYGQNAHDQPTIGPDRVLRNNGYERLLLLEALGGMAARTGDPEELAACWLMAQRLEGLKP